MTRGTINTTGGGDRRRIAHLTLAPLWLAFAAMPSMAAAETTESEKSFEVYGFGQVDYIQDFNRVDPAWADTLRPSKIPTIDGQFGSDGQSIMSARQSRLGVQSTLPVGGSPLFVKFEFDLFGVGVDAGQTTIRPRHMYGQWGHWLGGQTNTLFMDGDAFPNVIDYWGPAGMVFLRNPQIRWTPLAGANSFAVAIERPSDDIDVGLIRDLDPTLGANIQSKEEAPDLTAQLRMTRGWGHIQLAGILRNIGYETLNTPGNEPKKSVTGWGADLTSNFKFGEKSKLILGVVYGEGIASYMNDGGTDLAPEASGGRVRAKAVPLLGVIAYLDLYWSEYLSSSIGYSRTQVDNTNLQSTDAFHSGDYASANLLWYPGKNVMVGAEVLWGKREDNNGASGDDVRLQISAKYSFSSKDFGI